MQRLSAKTTVWNEFSSTMASAVTCLATNQKFHFSKYIFDNMVKNLEGRVKFLMYPRFVQLFLDKQVEEMTTHKEIYVTPSHTKKVFANMKRGGKGFSQRPITDEAANAEHVPTHSNDPLFSGEDRLQLKELLELCTKLSERVLDLENTKTSQAAKITKLKERVIKLERSNKSRTLGLKRLRKVGRSTQVISYEDEDKEEVKVEKKLAKQKEEDANIAEWDNVQTMIDTDYELAARLQAQEQEELTIEEKSKLFVELVDKRKKHFARLRAEEQRRKPPTKAQRRNQMCTYLKNMAGFNHNQLKNKSFDEVQMAFDKTIGKELEQERIKKQKIDDDQEAAKMKKHMEIVVDEKEIAVDAIPLATKPLIIVDWKIIKEGKIGCFQLIRADRSSRRYSSMIKILQNINKEDLEILWKLVKAKHGNTRPEEAYERVYGYIKNHMKTVKSKQARIREWKSEQKPEAKARKSQTLSQSGQIMATSSMEKHTRGMGFALDPLTKEAQAVTSRNDSLAILEVLVREAAFTIGYRWVGRPGADMGNWGGRELFRVGLVPGPSFGGFGMGLVYADGVSGGWVGSGVRARVGTADLRMAFRECGGVGSNISKKFLGPFGTMPRGGGPLYGLDKDAHYPDAGLEQMVPDQMWIEEECMYDISATYGVSYWWFKRQKFYIDRHSAENNRRAIVRTHMRILSVIRIEVFSIYGYDYMKKIILRRADNQEYTIAENDFKDLYPSKFEDLNLVIRKRVEDFQLGIESYQTQLNLTKPRWEATGLEFMHDYKILDSHKRPYVRRQSMVMQCSIALSTKIYKFSDGTLQQIDEALDYRVKEFKVNKINPGLNTRFWTTNDVIKSKQFMFAIQKRLKLRRIFRNLESFVGGRIREGDYRLLWITE
ncbi:hypothetical protein Tco_1234896 [Tanacetum coccineum]